MNLRKNKKSSRYFTEKAYEENIDKIYDNLYRDTERQLKLISYKKDLMVELMLKKADNPSYKDESKGINDPLNYWKLITQTDCKMLTIVMVWSRKLV